MTNILGILDLVVVMVVVINLSRAVWIGPSGSSRSLILSICVTAALIIFGLTSLLAAAGLTASSPFHRGALLVFLAATAVATLLWRAKKPVAATS